MKQLKTVLQALTVAAALCWATNVSANIVVDGGFELSPAPDFHSAWTLDPAYPTQLSVVGSNPIFAHSGSQHAFLEFSGAGLASLSQTLTTTAGTFYTLSFWLANDVADPTGTFEAQVNGVTLFSTTAAIATGMYQNIMVGFLATSNSTLLDFRYSHFADFWRLDDVSVTVPEGGASLWIAVPLLGGLCLMGARLRRTAAQT